MNNTIETFEPILNKKEQEKTKEELLLEFKESLEKYGVENIECRLEQGRLIIEQKLGSGIRGLGYDKNKKDLWLCLDQSNSKTVKENERWNANTILDLEKELPGIVIEKIDKERMIIKIAIDHPVSALARLTGKQDSVYLPGKYNNWQFDQPFIKNNKTGELTNEIAMSSDSTECKIAISDMTCDWESGKWQNEASQKMEAQLVK